MQFVVGIILGAAAGGTLMCIMAYKKINHTYMDGYNAGKEAGPKEEVDVSIVVEKYHEGYEDGYGVGYKDGKEARGE